MQPDPERQAETYAASGVDIDAAARAVDSIKQRARQTHRPEVLTGVGPFAGLFQLTGYREPVLVSSADGVGTKLKIAIALDRHDTVGVDLVNHSVNDILTAGADPLFFLDYISVGRLVPERVAEIAAGLAAACKEAGCALIGGETAEMPGMYAPDDYDLAGFIVGAVERYNLMDIGEIVEGDALLALPSSGLHTNGFSLVRRVFGVESNPRVLGQRYSELDRTLGEELLEPHRCYYRQLRPLLGAGSDAKSGRLIKGMAHITGGGMRDNLARMLPPGVSAVVRSSGWRVPPIFSLIQSCGGISTDEMYRVFNMGVGMVVVTSAEDVGPVQAQIPDAVVIGEVVAEGDQRVMII